MIKKLDWLVLKSFIGPQILTFFIVLFVFVLQFLWMYIDDLAGKGLELNVLAELLFHFTLVFVPNALPLAILLAALMTFGNMGENFELTAIKSSGISLQRIMRPLIIFIVLMSIGSFFFSNNVVPYANRKAKTLMYDITQKRPELNIQAGTFYNGIEGFSIKIGRKDPETNKLEKILIYDHRDTQGNKSLVMADSGYMNMTPDESGLIFTLYNGYAYNDIEEKGRSASQKKYPFRSDHFSEQIMIIELSGFDLERSDLNLFKSHQTMQNMSQLKYYIDSLSERLETREEGYVREYKTSKIYSRRNYYTRDIEKDTASMVNLVFNVDSLYSALDPIQQQMVVSHSLNQARSGLQYIEEKSNIRYAELKHILKFKAEWHRKITLAVSCIIFFFIGAPLGAIIRRGGLGTPVVIAVLFFVIWYVLTLFGEKVAKEGIAPVPLGMWESTVILMGVGIFLTYKATSDAAIMNKETYTAFFRNIGKKLGLVQAGDKDEATD
ncbi:MAG TPA: YjgP/YjgQ family permease [Bacteroidetes bacterium]|nr:YjgP/YjgQ family permease [Bacteroidota bacterium]